MTDLTRFTDGSIAGRQAALPRPLRSLHRAVLRRFLDTGAPPTARWIRRAAASHGGLDTEILNQEGDIKCGRLNFGTLLSGKG